MKIRIYKPHTHAGKHYTPGPEGIELDVKPHHVEYMRKLKLDQKPETRADTTVRSPVETFKPQA